MEDLEAEGSNPKALEGKPVIYEWMSEYFKAFDLLNATRSYGMGPNPIQLTQILAYIQLYRYEDDVETLVEYVLRMDGAFLEAQAKKQERERQKHGK